MHRSTFLKFAGAALASTMVTGIASAADVDASIPAYQKVNGVDGSLKSIGSDTLNNLMTLWAEGYSKQYPNVKIEIEGKDLFEIDLGKVDVVTLYLGPKLNERLLPQLGRLRPGARVVCHAFAIPEVQPDRVVKIRSEEDGLEHQVFLYTTPLKRAKKPE